MSDVELVIESRDDILDVAAFLVALRVIGCGLYRAINAAKDDGYTATAYIVRKYYPRLYNLKVLDAHHGSICIGPRGVEIVDECLGDVVCVRNILDQLLSKT